LLETAVLSEASSEFEERNALSRGYYAFFHACSAWLLGNGFEPGKKHGTLHDQMQRRLGRNFGRALRDLYEMRKDADYDSGWVPIKPVSLRKLKAARTNIFWLCLEAEKNLE